MNYEKYLPIGTVVMLKEGTKRVMITGFVTKSSENENLIYDYSGCLYPEGVISSDKTLLFNHDKIKEIYHMGYIDNEEKDFKEKLLQVLTNNIEKNEKSITNTVNNTSINNELDIEEITFEEVKY